jgi:hypothetical protein
MEKQIVRVSRTERSIQLWDNQNRPVILKEVVETCDILSESGDLSTEGEKPQNRKERILEGISINAIWDLLKLAFDYMLNFCRDLM